MARRLSLPKNIQEALGNVADNFEKVPMLAAIVEQMPAPERNLTGIATQFSKRAALPSSVARQIVTQLLSFHQLGNTFGMTPTEVYEALTESLETEATDEWKVKHLEHWKSARNVIEAVSSSSHPLYLVQKIARLKYEHQNILYSTNILTDARPVFDESGRDLKQMNIEYVLEVVYSDGAHRHQLFAALDVRDLAKLKAQCERAQTKAVTLKKALESVSVPIIVTGEIDDE